MSFFKKIWFVLIGVFKKKKPSEKNIIRREKKVLAKSVDEEVLFKEIFETDDEEKKEKVRKKIIEQRTAKGVIEVFEEKKAAASQTQYLFDTNELQQQINELETKGLSLSLQILQFKNLEYLLNTKLDKEWDKLFNKTLSSPKSAIQKINTGFSPEGLDELLKKKSTLETYRKREADKAKKEKEYRKTLSKKLFEIEDNIKHSKYEEATNKLNDLSPTIKSKYKKEHKRYHKAKIALIEKRNNELKALHDAEKVRIAKHVAQRKAKEEENRRAEALKRQAEKTKRILEEQKKEEQKRALELLLTKKENWREIRRVLEENGVNTFYHFTDIRNIQSIKQRNGLYSWKFLDMNSIDIGFSGGDALSRSLDARNKLEDYVRVSFCLDHPMQYRLKQNGFNLVVLKVSLEVAYYKNTLYSNTNATANNSRVGGYLEDLERINFKATKRKYVSRDDPEFGEHQAEVLVKTWIPKSDISNLNDFVQ